jgi:hypothetical protein
MTAVKACPEAIPNTPTATANASSKLLPEAWKAEKLLALAGNLYIIIKGVPGVPFVAISPEKHVILWPA